MTDENEELEKRLDEVRSAELPEGLDVQEQPGESEVVEALEAMVDLRPETQQKLAEYALRVGLGRAFVFDTDHDMTKREIDALTENEANPSEKAYHRSALNYYESRL